MSVRERLKMYLKYKNIGQRYFARTIEMSDGYVNAIRKSIQPDTLSKISSTYPDLNITWLLTGEGEMINQEYIIKEITVPVLKKNSFTDEEIKEINKMFEEMKKRAEELLYTIELQRKIIDGDKEK